jgi:hypothetical protein
MQQHSKREQSPRALASSATIRRAIQDRACLSGTHVQFRVRFAPHALGRDEEGRHIVFAFEYGGLTLGRSHWMWFDVDRLRDLRPTEDPWRSGPLDSRPRLDLTDIEAAVNDSSPRRHALARGARSAP